MTRKELLKLIKSHCIDCCGDDPKEVKACRCVSCKLYSYRFGKDSKRVKRVLSEEERLMRVESIKRAREARNMKGA